MNNGQKLKEIRRVLSEHKKCTQADFAKMLGTSRPAIGLMEAGQRPITENFKRRVHEVTGAEFVDEYNYPVVRKYTQGGSKVIYVRFEFSDYLKYKHKSEGASHCPYCGQLMNVT